MARQKSEPVEEVEDRSRFNCQACGGEGLVVQDKVCDACDGTGVAKTDAVDYPEGTIRLTQTQTLRVQDGQWVEV